MIGHQNVAPNENATLLGFPGKCPQSLMNRIVIQQPTPIMSGRSDEVQGLICEKPTKPL